MVKVIPFRAYRYDKAKVNDLSKVVAPPYDVIKDKMVDTLQSVSPYNMAWISKNKPTGTDNDSNNQYTRARDIWKKWLKEGAVKQDAKECFYVYGHDFEAAGKKLFRFGFIGLLELEDFATKPPAKGPFAGVLQHEETLPKDIMDRLNLCRQTMTQFGLIFVIYPDPKREVDAVLERYIKNAPLLDVTDMEGVRHRLWAVDNPADTKRISELMKDKYVIIADGHHRYKTALALSKENPSVPAAKYRMLTFVNMANPGLVILPTHRLVQSLENFSKQKLLDGAKQGFEVKDFKTKEEMFAVMRKQSDAKRHAFGLFINDGKFYVLTLKDLSLMDKVVPDKSPQWRSLDVAILHSLILDKVLGIGKEKLAQGTMKGEGYVIYIKDVGDAVDEAIKSVKEKAQAVFFMNPPKVEEVEAVSRNFEIMPQKSTFFAPKLFDGLTMNKLA